MAQGILEVIWVLLGILALTCLCLLVYRVSCESFQQPAGTNVGTNVGTNAGILSPIRGVPKGGRLPPTNKYILFEIDCGGLNNIRMQLEILVGIAWLAGDRTLVLPPKTNWYLLGDTKYIVSDVFDFDCLAATIPVLTYDEWLLTKGESANVTYETFFRNLRSSKYGEVSEPEWSPSKILFDTKLLSREPSGIWYFFCAKDGRHAGSHRMFGNPECYLRDVGEPEVFDAIWNAVRYRKEFYDTAEGILRKLGLGLGGYNAIHVRLWETKQFKTVAAKKVLEHIETLDPNVPILVLSQDPIEGMSQEITNNPTRHKFIYPPHLDTLVSQSIVDMLLAVPAKKFIGSPLSTYSTGIMMLRYRMGTKEIDVTPKFLDDSDRTKCGSVGTEFDKIILP